MFSLTWLPEVLEGAGLKVAEVPGWRTRGRASMGTIRGVMCHHTATPSSIPGNIPSLRLLTEGRGGASPLPGPLAQLGLGRDGTYYVIAAGRANHAGRGQWESATAGNSSFIGIEAEHSGRDDEEWPAVQVDAYRRGVAAILAHLKLDARMCCGHKEYALPKGRKPDPNFDMPDFRSEVSALLAGKTPLPPIPAEDEQARPTIRRGSRGVAVGNAQERLGVTADKIFGPETEAETRRFQRKHKLTPDGIIGPKTWVALDKFGISPSQVAAATTADPPMETDAPIEPAPAGPGTIVDVKQTA